MNAQLGMSVYNAWTREERRYWHEMAGSCVPADAVAARSWPIATEPCHEH